MDIEEKRKKWREASNRYLNRKDNRIKNTERIKKTILENREEYLLKKKNYNLKIKDKRILYYENTKEERWKINRQRYYLLKEEVYKILGDKCSKCSFKDKRALQIDHVNGGGGKEKNGVKRETAITKKLKNIKENPLNYQILCANCNWIKRFENGETGTYYDKIIKNTT